jgi:sialic acid synthase SpsE
MKEKKMETEMQEEKNQKWKIIRRLTSFLLLHCSANYLTPCSRVFLESRQSLSYSVISQYFMEPEGSLP